MLRDLYQEVILDHNKNPRNFHENVDATNIANGFNPLCGDKLTLFVTVEDDVIIDVSFTGCGCAISIASASLLTQSIIGMTCLQAKELFKKIHHLLTTDEEVSSIGKLEVLAGVRQYPARVKCASLAWHTFESALTNSKLDVKTEE